MWGILPEGLFASGNARAWVEGPRVVRCIMGVPQQVNVEGVLGENEADTLVKQYTGKYTDLHPQPLEVTIRLTAVCEPHLIFLTPSLLVVVEDVISYIVLRFSDKQT